MIKKVCVLLGVLILFNLIFISSVEINSDSSFGGVIIDIPEIPINFSQLNVNSSNFWDSLDSPNLTQMENNGGILNILQGFLSSIIQVFSLNQTEADDLYVNVDGGDNMTGNYNITGNLEASLVIANNFFVNNAINFSDDEGGQHRFELTKDSTTYGSVIDESFHLHHPEEHTEGNILFFISNTNSLHFGVIQGLNNSANYFDRSLMVYDLDSAGINNTKATSCFEMADANNWTIQDNCDTVNYGSSILATGAGNFRRGVFIGGSQDGLSSGIQSEGFANFFITGNTDFNIANGSLHISQPVNFTSGFSSGDSFTSLNVIFEGILAPFSNDQSDFGNWQPVSAPALCSEGQCARSTGAGGGDISMTSPLSTFNVDQTSVLFVYSLVDLFGTGLFSVNISNSTTSEILFSDATNNVVLSSQSIAISEAWSNLSDLNLHFRCNFGQGATVSRQCYVDTVKVNGTFTANTTAPQNSQDGEICFRDAVRDSNGNCNIAWFYDAKTNQMLLRGATLNASGTIIGGISGSGTTNNWAKFLGATNIGNAPVSDDGSLITIILDTLINGILNITNGLNVANNGTFGDTVITKNLIVNNSALFVSSINDNVLIGNISLSAKLGIEIDVASKVGQIIKGASSQSEDYLQIIDNGDNLLVNIDEEGSYMSRPTVSAVFDSIREGSLLLTLTTHSNTAAQTPNFVGKRSRGTEASQTAVQENDRLFSLGARGHDGNNIGTANRAQILFNADGNWNTTSNPTKVIFRTTEPGTTSTTNKITIKGDGKTGFGTGTPGVLVEMEDTGANQSILRLQDSDGLCDFNPEAGGIDVSCSSDEDLKENITDVNKSSILDKIMNFRIRDYIVKASNKEMVGVIAQEINITNPEMVTTIIDKNCTNIEIGIDEFNETIYDEVCSEKEMILVQQPNPWELVSVIQELKQQNDNLKSIIDNLFVDGAINVTGVGDDVFTCYQYNPYGCSHGGNATCNIWFSPGGKIDLELCD